MPRKQTDEQDSLLSEQDFLSQVDDLHDMLLEIVDRYVDGSLDKYAVATQAVQELYHALILAPSFDESDDDGEEESNPD